MHVRQFLEDYPEGSLATISSWTASGGADLTGHRVQIIKPAGVPELLVIGQSWFCRLDRAYSITPEAYPDSQVTPHAG